MTKLFACGNGGHVLRETTSRGLCGLVCHALVSAGDTEIFKEFVAKKKRSRNRLVGWGLVEMRWVRVLG